MSRSHRSARQVFANKVADPYLGDNLFRATEHTLAKRSALIREMGSAWLDVTSRAHIARDLSSETRDHLIDRFVARATARGWHVHRASTRAQAREIILQLIQPLGGPVTKSKSLTSEEIQINPALEAAGIEVVETDLGELIVQLAGEPPSHVTAPAIHMNTEQIARLFRDRLGMQVPSWVDDPPGTAPSEERKRLAERLSLRAREHLREKFLGAVVGITGANFLVAESGTVVLLENEGNIQLSACLPQRHIVLAGIDKIIASDKDLGPLLRVLPTSATAQRQTCYVSLFADEHPDLHVVLLDAGRSDLAKDQRDRELLRCIRCGACMNVCPVYRNAGGHAYQGAYPGPIGAALLPRLEDGEKHHELPFACSVCGACTEACPVGIPLHQSILELRARLVDRGEESDFQQMFDVGTAIMASERAFSLAEQLYPAVYPIADLLPVASRWTAERDLPAPPPETFREWWHRTRGDIQRLPSQPGPKSAPPASDQQFPADSTAGAAPLTTHTTTDQPRSSPEPAIEDSDQPPQALKLWKHRFSLLGDPERVAVHECSDWSEALQRVHSIVQAQQPRMLTWEPQTPDKRTYDLGVSRARLLIADTGGLVLDFASRQHARVANLAVHHLVIADPTQIVDNVEEALAWRETARGSGHAHDLQVFVTGPSRTADIEKVLVIPAHGPSRLTVVLVPAPWNWQSLTDLLRDSLR